MYFKLKKNTDLQLTKQKIHISNILIFLQISTQCILVFPFLGYKINSNKVIPMYRVYFYSVYKGIW